MTRPCRYISETVHSSLPGAATGSKAYLTVPVSVASNAQIPAGWALYNSLPSYPNFVGMAGLLREGIDTWLTQFVVNGSTSGWEERNAAMVMDNGDGTYTVHNVTLNSDISSTTPSCSPAPRSGDDLDDLVVVPRRGASNGAPRHRSHSTWHRTTTYLMTNTRPSLPIADEPRLLTRARERDPLAFEQLIVAHAPPLQRMLRRMLGSTSDAEEVLQETLLKAWRAIDRFRGEARFSTWLYRIALNEARRRQAYDASRRALPIDDVMVELPDLSAGPVELAESAELERFIERCVAELPANYREAVVLRDVVGLSNEEAAEVLELDLRNFKSRLHRGRMVIRRRVEERYG